MPTVSQRRNFLRHVYAQGADEAARSAYLSGLLTTAHETLSGKTLIASSGKGVTVQFEQVAGVGVQDVASMVDWAFGLIGEADIDAALALVPRHGVRTLRAEFSGLRG